MSDPMQNLNDAAQALAQVAARAGAFYDDADVKIEERRAAYDALAGDLKGVVSDEMRFTATVDPDALVEIVGDGGTYQTIRSAIEDAPSGSHCTITLQAGKTHELESAISCHSLNVLFESMGAGARPLIKPLTGVSGDLNRMNQFIAYGICSFSVNGCDIEMPQVDVDPALSWWAAAEGIFRAPLGATLTVVINNSKLTCLHPDTHFGLTSCINGAAVIVALKSCEFDGAFARAVTRTDLGTALISQNSVTLSNGAAIYDGGTVGTNILINS